MEQYTKQESRLDVCARTTEEGAYANNSYLTGGEIVATQISTDPVGRSICEWFYYTLPREINDTDQPFIKLALRYFMENVQLQCIYNIEGQNKVDCVGLKMIIWVLSGIFKEENLRFSPNFEGGGLKTEMDRYGILTVEMSGTVHKDNSYIGIFDHTFTAVRCPNTGGFRIKSVQLKMVK
ncbi:uncharacterized protein C3orf38-like [Anomaloglossus baeobatrachus]|uniref:uncharacterized protein C3orf38-like n=1 Tax=Anomaloglossus baeobatrachus TaxID=238106 RepID=UPI003F4FDBD4